jgi:photosystem II stability/assembly factor-like uncharacterized protein
MAFSPSSSASIVGTGLDVLQSVDDGASFSEVFYRNDTAYKSYVASDPSDSLTFYLATDSGFYRSSDGGKTWPLLSSPPLEPTALIADPSTPGRLFLTTQTAIYRSVDHGATWQSVRSVWPMSYSGLAIHASGAPLMVAGQEGILRSDDGGNSFLLVSDGLPQFRATSVAIDPQQPNVAYAGTSIYGLYKTVSGGR